jgi:hypothetical protein
MRRQTIVVLALCGIVACAAQPPPPKAASAPQAAPAGAPAADAPPPPAQPTPAPEEPVATPRATTESAAQKPGKADASKAPAASGTYAQPPPNRAAALAQASNDIEASMRELDVAGGDCKNACRALSSMDRAAGRLCSLAQSSDESKRCDGAKTKLFGARDRVRSTCGSCPDVSVDRGAPVPSR